MHIKNIFQDDSTWTRMNINDYLQFSIRSAKAYTKEGRYAYCCHPERRNTIQRYEMIYGVFLFIFKREIFEIGEFFLFGEFIPQREIWKV